MNLNVFFLSFATTKWCLTEHIQKTCSTLFRQAKGGVGCEALSSSVGFGNYCVQDISDSKDHVMQLLLTQVKSQIDPGGLPRQGSQRRVLFLFFYVKYVCKFVLDIFQTSFRLDMLAVKLFLHTKMIQPISWDGSTPSGTTDK